MSSQSLPTEMAVRMLSPVTCGQFHKQFTSVTYSSSNIRCPVHYMHDSMLFFSKFTSFFAMVVIYVHKMFMKLIPGVNVIKLFFFFIDAPDKHCI
jgi:hypothetical protein